jgi:hypothetical protein
VSLNHFGIRKYNPGRSNSICDVEHTYKLSDQLWWSILMTRASVKLPTAPFDHWTKEKEELVPLKLEKVSPLSFSFSFIHHFSTSTIIWFRSTHHTLFFLYHFLWFIMLWICFLLIINFYDLLEHVYFINWFLFFMVFCFSSSYYHLCRWFVIAFSSLCTLVLMIWSSLLKIIIIIKVKKLK